ncbi:MAG: hypothetical protein LC722_08530, partial [Actinobacteria bacterium]|nr:hypothetical protein [Actinomycetota bacterium]
AEFVRAVAYYKEGAATLLRATQSSGFTRRQLVGRVGGFYRAGEEAYARGVATWEAVPSR